MLSRDLSRVEQASKWLALSTLVKVERWREDKATGQISHESVYYISGDPNISAAQGGALIRAHGRIENSLYRVLDVSLDEDAYRVRKGHAAENFGLIRRAALNRLHTAPIPPKNQKQYQPRPTPTFLPDEYHLS